jgi:hypothetical protein
LTAVERNGALREAAIQVIVDNQPPTIKIIHPQDGAIYSPEKDEWVSIGVEAVDNKSMSRVEFYLDGGYLGANDGGALQQKVDNQNVRLSDAHPCRGSHGHADTPHHHHARHYEPGQYRRY